MSVWLWKNWLRPKKDEAVTVTAKRPALALDRLPPNATEDFAELLKVADATEIEFPHLKRIVAAQWALECGWGTSKLAHTHRNYAGAKWRAWLNDFGAKPVSYAAWDGVDVYAEFDSHASFIKAYWARFDKVSAYQDWRNHTATPEAFMAYIGPIWVAVSPDHGRKYVKNVERIDRDTMSKVFPRG